MFDFHEKRRIRNFLYSKPVIFALFLIAILMSFSVYNRYIVAQEMQMKLEEKQAELEEVKNRAQALEAKVNYLENDRGIEEELRNRFDVAREGEQVIILIDPKKEEKETSKDSDIPAKTQDSPHKSFLDFFRF